MTRTRPSGWYWAEHLATPRANYHVGNIPIGVFIYFGFDHYSTLSSKSFISDVVIPWAKKFAIKGFNPRSCFNASSNSGFNFS